MAKMTSASTRHYGVVFDQIARDYDHNRIGYPDSIVDYSCKLANLKPRDKVLEIGSGTGQLTKSLIARNLDVTAVEPGKNLITVARENIKDNQTIKFINAKFEEVDLKPNQYKAIFSASAFHWLDPETSWRKAAELLAPDGSLNLIQHFGLSDPATSSDLKLQLEAIKKFAPSLAAKWPKYHKLDEIMDGIADRKSNLSVAWSWLGNYDIERNFVKDLFEDTIAAATRNIIDHTAEELISVLRTISAYVSLSENQKNNIEDEYRRIYENLDRPFRSSIVTICLTAKRSA